jgi:hypothetical protein
MTPPTRNGRNSQIPSDNVDGAEDVLGPNDSDSIRDQIRGQTVEHANPPRLEDGGQPGG